MNNNDLLSNYCINQGSCKYPFSDCYIFCEKFSLEYFIYDYCLSLMVRQGRAINIF